MKIQVAIPSYLVPVQRSLRALNNFVVPIMLFNESVDAEN